MTKLAATAGATVEETFATAHVVPAIESSDINDGWIIDRTYQIDCGNGKMKFSIDLPGDTTPFECTPFQIDQKRGMMLMWMGAVRQGIIERAGAAQAATKEAQLKVLREKQMSGTGLIIPESADVDKEAAAAIVARAPGPPPTPPSIREYQAVQSADARNSDYYSDPVIYAQQQLVRATMEINNWDTALREAEANKNAAVKAASRWSKVLETIDV